jgi:hypothetical protein
VNETQSRLHTGGFLSESGGMQVPVPMIKNALQSLAWDRGLNTRVLRRRALYTGLMNGLGHACTAIFSLGQRSCQDHLTGFSNIGRCRWCTLTFSLRAEFLRRTVGRKELAIDLCSNRCSNRCPLWVSNHCCRFTSCFKCTTIFSLGQKLEYEKWLEVICRVLHICCQMSHAEGV